MVIKLSRAEIMKDPLIPHIRPSTKNRIRKYLYLAIFIIAIFLLYRSLNKNASGLGRNGDVMLANYPYPNENSPKVAVIETKPVLIDVYMESQCPDTSRFLRQQLKKTWEILGHSPQIQLTIIPFGKARCVEKDDDFQCQCQHGPTECEINQLMNCVIDRYGFPHKYINLILCMQGKRTLVDAMKCVNEAMPAEANRMQECANGPRGRRLLALAGQRTAALTPSIDFIPWIVINGQRNSDALYDLTQNVCETMDPKIRECQDYLSSLKK